MKTSLYFLKELSLDFSKSKSCEKLIEPVIRLVLITTSECFLNNGILDNKLKEVKENVMSCLKDTLQDITTIITKLEMFNVEDKNQGQIELEVRDIHHSLQYHSYLNIYFNFIVLEYHV